MTRVSHVLLVSLVVLFSPMLIGGEAPPPAFTLLVFSRTTGFRHGSIPDGRDALRALGETHGFAIEVSEDPTEFRDDRLGDFAAVVFLNTTGDILNSAQEAAFERYIRAGGGYIGLHSAADTEYDWPFYGEVLGAWFRNHPSIQTATLRVEDSDHASTETLPTTYPRRDEWYNFRRNPREDVRVLVTIDESSYSGGNMGTDHPITWCHEIDAGRAWYTAMGHTSETYREALFLEHLLGGVRYAAGLTGPCQGVTPHRSGDCNSDGVRDISDAVCLLRGLFAAGSGPCEEPVTGATGIAILDFDANERVDLADAIGILDELFRPESPPRAPRPCLEVAACAGRCESD